MAGLVSEHQISAFSDPQNGQDGDATVVLGNDNSIVTAYDAHDADGTIHLQSSTLATRSPAGTTGRKWMTVDSTTVRVFYDNGSSWLELNAFGVPVTVTSTTAPQVTVAYDGSNSLTISVSSGGVVTYNATTSHAFSDPVAITGLLSIARANDNVLSVDRTGTAGTIATFLDDGVAVLTVATTGMTLASGLTLTLTGTTIAGAPTWSSSQAITLSTAAQPNITSVGTLTSLTTVSDVTVGGVLSLSQISQATGGTVVWGNNTATRDQVTIVDAAVSTWTWGATVVLIAAATTTAHASLRLPHGTAPSSPVDGDMWTTTAGLFVRINGSTVGPLS